MPNLYTSLLAHVSGIHTLAPKEQRAPVPHETESLSPQQYTDHVSAHYAGVLDELLAVGPPTRSIGIIGAGLAGLCAAYELSKRRYNITIFEASDRPGGRTFTDHDLAKPHAMDKGAELIGSNHPLWLNYADTFHLGFTDVKEYKNSPILLGKTPLSEPEAKALFHEMDKAFDFISVRSKKIVDAFEPWTDPQASILDQQNVYDFVMHQSWDPLAKTAVLQQLESDNGVRAKDQSLLGLLSMVKGGGMERFWVDTEVYRCKRGAQALSLAFEAALRGLRISVRYGSPVTGIDATAEKIKLQVKHDPHWLGFDDVVLAIPPSAWNRVSSWLPTDLSNLVGASPQMGKNTKALLAFRSRFWEKDNQAPSSTQNGPVDQTWETTEAYTESQFGMVAFSGADHAEQLSQYAHDADALEHVIANLRQTYKELPVELASSEFVNWPKRDWAWASYSFPRCGDITTWGPMFSEGYAGKLHFAGEHTCYAFTGYMEGALQSGYRMARKLTLRDGKDWPQKPFVLQPAESR
jgi:monoamine oxidase